MIAVIGASGRIGRHVAQGLADRAVEAIALTRGSTRDLPIQQTVADLTDPPAVRSALDGVTRLFLLTPHGPDQDLLEAVAIDAAADARVSRIVKISGGAPSLGPNGTTATAAAHWHAEQRIEHAGMGFTFLRPSFLTQNLLTTAAPLVAKSGLLVAPFGHAPIAMVDARDVAACAVAALIDPEPVNQAWQLTGPRGVTFDDVAAHLRVRYLPVPPRLAGRALSREGALRIEVDHAVRMGAYFAAGVDGTPTDHVLRLSGHPPRPFTALLDEHRELFLPATGLARRLSRTPTPEV